MATMSLELTEVERHIIKHSSNLEVVQKRRKIALITGVALALLLVWAAYATESWRLMMYVFLAYIAGTVIERMLHANAILAYKRIVQKMVKRIEHLEIEEKC